MEINEAIKEMEKYREGMIECPDPYHDADIDALELLIEFAKSNLQNRKFKMEEIEIKLEIFKAVVNNSKNLCDSTNYISPSSAVHYANEVYEILTKKNINYVGIVFYNKDWNYS